LELDNSVGTRQLGPEAVVLNANDVKLLNRDHLDPDFKNARASSKSLKFRNRLMKSIWNQVPEAFKGGQQDLIFGVSINLSRTNAGSS
jgi:hypothetical protein